MNYDNISHFLTDLFDFCQTYKQTITHRSGADKIYKFGEWGSQLRGDLNSLWLREELNLRRGVLRPLCILCFLKIFSCSAKNLLYMQEVLQGCVALESSFQGILRCLCHYFLLIYSQILKYFTCTLAFFNFFSVNLNSILEFSFLVI